MSTAITEAIDPAQHLGLVWSVAHRLKRWASVYGVELDDLFSEGCIALVRAARAFDPSRGLQFSCLATRYIERRMVQHVQTQRTMGRLPAQNRESDSILDYIGTDDPRSASDARLTVGDLLQCLNRRERRVVTLHFGLDGKGERTNKQIGKVLGVAYQYVQQILSRAFDKMLYHAKANARQAVQGETFMPFDHQKIMSRCRARIN